MPTQKQKVEGIKQSDTKNMRKYATAWGIIYMPLTVVAELGNPDRVTFTIEAPGDDGGQG
jgi:hypothetical protein